MKKNKASPPVKRLHREGLFCITCYKVVNFPEYAPETTDRSLEPADGHPDWNWFAHEPQECIEILNERIHSINERANKLEERLDDLERGIRLGDHL